MIRFAHIIKAKWSLYFFSVFISFFLNWNWKFVITRKNDAYVAKIANMKKMWALCSPKDRQLLSPCVTVFQFSYWSYQSLARACVLLLLEILRLALLRFQQNSPHKVAATKQEAKFCEKVPWNSVCILRSQSIAYK